MHADNIPINRSDDRRGRASLPSPQRLIHRFASKCAHVLANLLPGGAFGGSGVDAMNRRDVLLAILAAADGRPFTPVQLQKAAFLVAKNLERIFDPSSRYAFAPYDYGPFDSNVYGEAETLARLGLVSISAEPGRYRQYVATDTGVKLGRQLLDRLQADDRRYVKDVASWVLRLSFGQLVKSIYTAYPDMRANSIFRY
jgi:hypothetical protein